MAGKASGDEMTKLSYRDDPRMPCKYGLKCYQKNKTHHEKYKHPPKRSSEERAVDKLSDDHDNQKDPINGKDDVKPPVEKKQKLECSEEEPSCEIPISTDNVSSKADLEEESTEEVISNSPDNPKDNIKQKFLVDMPEDFYKFWEFCESLSASNPTKALESLGLTLVGPFDVLSGKLSKVKIQDSSSYLRHWRYYYDPPEFLTVIKGDNKKQYHMGYYRDDPKEMPVFVACNSAAVNCTLTPLAGNLFGAVNAYMNAITKSGDPFAKVKVPKYQNALKDWAKKENISLDTKSPAMIARAKKVVASTFHKAGIVVPCDKKSEVGYRELLEDDGTIKKICAAIVESKTESEKKRNFSKLQPIITAANIANDECDFGASLELGLDLFSYGEELFHSSLLHLLETAYKLLQRPQFATIIKAHLKSRAKGTDLSIIK